MGKDHHLDYEEHYHRKGSKKHEKKLRKTLQKKDRSKYKKSDQDKVKAQEVPNDPNLKRGRVLSLEGDRVDILCQGARYEGALTGSLKKERTSARNLIIVGDFVRFYPKEGELCRIVHIDERHSALSRRAHFKGSKEQFIAANIDQVFIVVSLFAPKLKPSLIDRYIIAARQGNMAPIIVINKTDLVQFPPNLSEKIICEEIALFDALKSIYRDLNIPIIPTSTIDSEGLETIKELMSEKVSVFSGQSGAGKTSIINAITGLTLTTGAVVEKTRKGAHTTTASRMIPLEEGAFLIDTPGIKSFGMWDLTEQDLQTYFTEIHEASFACKYPNCRHLHEPGCAVKEKVDKGEISPLRYHSYLSLL